MSGVVAEGKRIAEHLLDYVKLESGELIVPAIRFDFFVDLQFNKNQDWSGGAKKNQKKQKKDPIPADDQNRPPCQHGYIRLPSGDFCVTTLEICELGFSCLYNAEIPRKVMEAVARSCIRGNEKEIPF